MRAQPAPFSAGEILFHRSASRRDAPRSSASGLCRAAPLAACCFPPRRSPASLPPHGAPGGGCGLGTPVGAPGPRSFSHSASTARGSLPLLVGYVSPEASRPQSPSVGGRRGLDPPPPPLGISRSRTARSRVRGGRPSYEPPTARLFTYEHLEGHHEEPGKIWYSESGFD